MNKTAANFRRRLGQISRQDWTILLGIVLGLLTLITGYVGWKWEGVDGFWRRLYLTLLAFGGDAIYAPVLEPGKDPVAAPLSSTRFLGLATTLVAAIVILSALLADTIARLRARWRVGHGVLIGSSTFGIERLRKEIGQDVPLTILGPANPPPEQRAGQIHIPVQLSDVDAILRFTGRPRTVLFGSQETVRNVACARAVLPRLEAASVLMRVEDIALVRDLGHLAPELAQVETVSSSEAVAEALLRSTAFSEMAELRDQPGLHMVLVGLGATNLAIAEQLSVAGYRPDNAGSEAKRLRLTVLDDNLDFAHARLHGQSPGLKGVAQIVLRRMDGRDCLQESCLRTLTAIERMQPVTAILVATGDDARNAAIGLRLRQVQTQHLILKAPILVRNHMRIGHAPDRISTITHGLFDFGGDSGGGAHKASSDALAKAMHDTGVERRMETWSKLMIGPRPVPWGALSAAERRSPRLAARAAPDMLRAAGLLDDPGNTNAALKVASTAVPYLQSRKDMLMQLEHERWGAEKRLNVWRQANEGEARDDERRIHTALVPWDVLPENERRKDLDNVEALIASVRDAPAEDAAIWRRRFRIGVMGPLNTDTAGRAAIEAAVTEYLALWPAAVPLEGTNLEILTPDAPGFDRIAATVLTEAWHTYTGRRCRLIALRAAGRTVLDEKAAEHLTTCSLDRSTLMMRFAAQSEALASASGAAAIWTEADLRPPSTSDADLRRSTADKDSQYRRGTDRVADRIDALSDLLIWGSTASTGAHARSFATRREAAGGACLHIEMPQEE